MLPLPFLPFRDKCYLIERLEAAGCRDMTQDDNSGCMVWYKVKSNDKDSINRTIRHD